MQKIVSADLPRGIANDWAGQSLQELISGAQAPMLFALSILVCTCAWRPSTRAGASRPRC